MVQAVKKDMPGLIKENEELKERVLELEMYKMRWNLKMHCLKEKDEKVTPSWKPCPRLLRSGLRRWRP